MTCPVPQILKLNVKNAVEQALAHDMTQIIPGRYKGAAFKKGDVVTKANLCQLMRMGKRHLYILDLDDNHINEDDAMLELSTALAGPGVTFSGSPREGKLQLTADYDRLFKVNVDALVDSNMIIAFNNFTGYLSYNLQYLQFLYHEYC